MNAEEGEDVWKSSEGSYYYPSTQNYIKHVYVCVYINIDSLN